MHSARPHGEQRFAIAGLTTSSVSGRPRRPLAFYATSFKEQRAENGPDAASPPGMALSLSASTAQARQLLVKHGAAALDAFLPADGSSHQSTVDTRAFTHKFASAIGMHDAALARGVASVVDPLNVGTVQFDAVAALVGLRPAALPAMPPKRAPPAPPTAASLPALLAEAKRTGDADMVAVLSALEWTNKHLSRSPSKSPKKRLRPRDLTKHELARALDSEWAGTALALSQLRTDGERGTTALGLLACQVDAELAMRASLAEVDEALVDEALRDCWVATPRPVRMAVAQAAKEQRSPRHALMRQLRALSQAHLPLALTTLTVEMEAAFRAACADHVEESGVAHAWASESEAGRAAALSHLFDCGCFDDALLASAGGQGLKTCLLGYDAAPERLGPARNDDDDDDDDDTPVQATRHDAFDEPRAVYEPSPQDYANAELIARLQASFADVARMAAQPSAAVAPRNNAADDDAVVQQVKELQARILAVFDAVAI